MTAEDADALRAWQNARAQDEIAHRSLVDIAQIAAQVVGPPAAAVTYAYAEHLLNRPKDETPKIILPGDTKK